MECKDIIVVTIPSVASIISAILTYMTKEKFMNLEKILKNNNESFSKNLETILKHNFKIVSEIKNLIYKPEPNAEWKNKDNYEPINGK